MQAVENTQRHGAKGRRGHGLSALAVSAAMLSMVTGCGNLVAGTPALRPLAPEAPACELDAIAAKLLEAGVTPPMEQSLTAGAASGDSCTACHTGGPTDRGGAWGPGTGTWDIAVNTLLAAESAQGAEGNSLETHINGSSGEPFHELADAALGNVRTYIGSFFENGGNACAVCGNKEVTLPEFESLGIASMFADSGCTACHGGGSPSESQGGAWGPGGITTPEGWHDAVAALSGPDAAAALPFGSYSIYLHVTTDDGLHNVPAIAANMESWLSLFVENGGAGCGGGGNAVEIVEGGDGDGDGDIVIPPFDQCGTYQAATPAEITASFSFGLLSALPGPACRTCHVVGASGNLQYDESRDSMISALSPLILEGQQAGQVVTPDATPFGAKILLPTDPTHVTASQQAGFDEPLLGNQLRTFIDTVRNGVCGFDPNEPVLDCSPTESLNQWNTRVLGGLDSFPVTCYNCHANKAVKGQGTGWGADVQGDAGNPISTDKWHDAAVCSVAADTANPGFSGLPNDTELYRAMAGISFPGAHDDIALKVQYSDWAQWRITNCPDYACP